ncbi:Uncharacterised protein [Mycobacteroides abscessus subsp. abscessus]|nr:Uncharacterised protein [Mycobacteroides abscessus subsp. abscessus]
MIKAPARRSTTLISKEDAASWSTIDLVKRGTISPAPVSRMLRMMADSRIQRGGLESFSRPQKAFQLPFLIAGSSFFVINIHSFLLQIETECSCKPFFLLGGEWDMENTAVILIA